jgi:hypothetical protein
MLEIDVFRSVDAATNKGAAVAIEQHNADAGTVGQIFNAHCKRVTVRSDGNYDRRMIVNLFGPVTKSNSRRRLTLA